MLSTEEEGELVGLLAAVKKPAVPLSERLGSADIIRKWAWMILVGLFLAGSQVYTIKVNTVHINRLETKMKEIRPLVRRHEWQFRQGLTDHDLKERGITAPNFTEDDD